MKHVKKYIAWVAALCLGVMFSAVAGAEEAEKNAITAITVATQGNAIMLKIDLKAALAELPTEFSIANPPRIALDFKGVDNSLESNRRVVKEGDLTSLDVIQSGDKTRLVFNLVRNMHYAARLEEASLLITLTPLENADMAQKTAFTQETIRRQHEIRDISFRRGKDGEGRVIVDLSDAGAGINIRQQGNDLVVDFLKTDLPDNLRRRMDVVDFATPVTSVVTDDKGEHTRMTITSKGNWEHNAYQTENQFVVEVKAIVEDPNKLVQTSKLGYQGPRISINYQNGDVRALLRLMAEELGFNAVISETVRGTTTLVLKDVPADQVIDIIFQQKGLDMRKNGNVILIAPRDELATREKLKYETERTREELEPLVMESFQLNYHKAGAIQAILSSKDQQILSKRGTVSTDPRTNILFVRDTPDRLDEVRRLLAQIDVPLRQVLIEARIVEATDTFAKNLGVRLGLLHSKNYTNGGTWFGMGGASSETMNRGGATTTPARSAEGGRTASDVMNPAIGATSSTVTFPAANQVNLPAQGYGNAGAQLFSFLLANREGTRMLNLEISALEADLKGRVVSNPRVLTSDNGEALIEQGVEIPYQETAGNSATSVSFKKAVLSLKVTPQITPDGKVAMKIEVNKDSRGETVPGGVSINTKKVQTSVLVENGGTVVIGGIYELTSRNDIDKVPLLGDMPVLGYFFRSQSRVSEKSELLVFITPRILNENLTIGSN
ncbi:MAG: type IV pilus secretin PilQ [Zoogloeaceae bacterium]|jgi:type IV pilus assembly protein PilQ|nr:type IV pilus secretin PilQ [Zoogloeaceae bacterium]